MYVNTKYCPYIKKVCYQQLVIKLPVKDLTVYFLSIITNLQIYLKHIVYI